MVFGLFKLTGEDESPGGYPCTLDIVSFYGIKYLTCLGDFFSDSIGLFDFLLLQAHWESSYLLFFYKR